MYINYLLFNNLIPFFFVHSITFIIEYYLLNFRIIFIVLNTLILTKIHEKLQLMKLYVH